MSTHPATHPTAGHLAATAAGSLAMGVLIGASTFVPMVLSLTPWERYWLRGRDRRNVREESFTDLLERPGTIHS